MTGGSSLATTAVVRTPKPSSTMRPPGACPPVIDEFGYDLVDLPGVSLDETVFESFNGGA